MKPLIIIILLFLLVGVIIAIYCIYEAHLLEITYAKLSPSGTKKNDHSTFIKSKNEYFKEPVSLSESEDYLRVIFFSDIHSEFCFVKEEYLESVLDSLIEKYKIDVIAFGGDICNKPYNIDKGIRYFSKLSAYCNSKNVPFIGTTGNHDLLVSDEDISKCGYMNVNNASFTIRDFEIRGLWDSGRTNRVWGNNPFTEHKKTNILLSHNPDWILDAADRKDLNTVDYMLSGHIHGGQMRMPFALENRLFRKDLLPKRNVVNGVFDGAGVKFFISKGIGCVLLPFRFLVKPEITIIDIPSIKKD